MDHSDFDSTLLISLYTNVPTLYFSYPGLAPCPIPWRIASPGGAISLPEKLFFSQCDSHPLMPSLLTVTASSSSSGCLRTWVLPSPSFTRFHQHTHWTYFYNTLPPPLYILGLFCHMQHRLMYSSGPFQSLPLAYIPSYACMHTQILTLNMKPHFNQRYPSIHEWFWEVLIRYIHHAVYCPSPPPHQHTHIHWTQYVCDTRRGEGEDRWHLADGWTWEVGGGYTTYTLLGQLTPCDQLSPSICQINDLTVLYLDIVPQVSGIAYSYKLW